MLHQARFEIGYGDHAGSALEHQGHGYLGFASIAVALLFALAAGQLLRLVTRAWRSGRGQGTRLPLGLTWLLATLALTGIYTGQELLEGMLATGHPAGLDAVATHGGLVAYPLAVVLGGVVALGLRGADAVIAAAAARLGRVARSRRSPSSSRRPRFVIDVLRPPVLASGRAGRAPPALS